MAISNKVGPPVTGEDFYGRKAELARAHSYLASGHSLVLSAPRRIGKSSFAKKLIADQEAKGWRCVYVDLEGTRTRDEFLQNLICQFNKSGIWTEAANIAGSIMSGIVEGIRGVGPLQFDFSQCKDSKNLYTSLSEVMDHTKDTLVVIDELTLFLGALDRETANPREAGFFLNWFRSLRQMSDSKIRWIFCGSVGLHNFTRMRNLSMTINDMVSFDFDALVEDEARGLVIALCDAEGIAMDDEVVTALLDKIEWYVPYFIQLIFTNVKNNRDRDQGITVEMIDRALDKLVHTDELNTWSERLSEYNGQEEGARFILKELSRTEQAFSKDQLLVMYRHYLGTLRRKAEEELTLILNMLEHDGYILRISDGKRRFRSPLLRRWWYYKFVE